MSGFSQGGTYLRSDSMPAASIRLALEEKRREHEKKRYLETCVNKYWILKCWDKIMQVMIIGVIFMQRVFGL